MSGRGIRRLRFLLLVQAMSLVALLVFLAGVWQLLFPLAHPLELRG